MEAQGGTGHDDKRDRAIAQLEYLGKLAKLISFLTCTLVVRFLMNFYLNFANQHWQLLIVKSCRILGMPKDDTCLYHVQVSTAKAHSCMSNYIMFRESAAVSNLTC